VKREHLEHVLRAASQIAEDPDVLVIGSQSILGAIDEERLPPEATASIEVDVAFFDDPDDRKADQVDGAIGELSAFHETFGYYAQGVSATTAVLPDGWRDRLVLVQTASTAPGRGHLLDPTTAWCQSWSRDGRRTTPSPRRSSNASSSTPT
jgi:hypothetical protein